MGLTGRPKLRPLVRAAAPLPYTIDRSLSPAPMAIASDRGNEIALSDYFDTFERCTRGGGGGAAEGGNRSFPFFELSRAESGI